jgi:hypothetical protein
MPGGGGGGGGGETKFPWKGLTMCKDETSAHGP